jgi:peroxiredoxin
MFKKRELKKRHWLLTLMILASAVGARGQVITVEPQKPKHGEMLAVTYNPMAEGAVLKGGDDIYVIVGTYYTHGIEGFIAKMSKQGSVFKYEFPVRQPVSAVQFNFLTLQEWREKSYYNTLVYRPDGEPVKGAYQSKIQSKGWQMAASELALYPDNYAAYPEKWRWAGIQDRDSQLKLVKDDMARLAAQTKDQPADLLYALSYGYMLLKQEAKSRELIRALNSLYPSSPFMANAINLYSSLASAGEGWEEVSKIRLDLIQQYPDTGMARRWIPTLTSTKEFPLEGIEKICRRWIAEEVDNPRPYLTLARAYLQRQQKIEQAAALAEEAINLLLQDRLKLYDDIAGTQTAGLLPAAYLTSAEIALQSHNYAKALSAVKAAQTLEKETRPKSYLLEGEVWRLLGTNPGGAEAAYLEAWRRGGKEAEEPLKAIYQKQNGSLTGFDQYLADKKAEEGTTGTDKKLAPTFDVKSLTGESLNLAALRGKVVVLNFWYTSCGPCRAEMPGLNQLVSEFQDKGVVFIAFALDRTAELRAFTKEVRFKYQVIPDSEKISQLYQVTSYPTHVIIGKDGQLLIVQSGGNSKRHEELRPFIERALMGGRKTGPRANVS